MKMLEGLESKRVLPLIPVCARLDGKRFSKFTKGLLKPFDKRLIDLMIHVTKCLVENTNADIGYTQSDEISLIWKNDSYKTQIFFDGKIQKMVSVLSSMTTAFFNKSLGRLIEDKADQIAMFDCRIWQVPNLMEATNVLLWREQDATRNSVSSAAQFYFSHKQLQKKTTKQKQEMLFREHGVNWNDYPNFFKRGTYVQRKRIKRKFTTTEIEKLPTMHEARKNPNLEIERVIVSTTVLPPLATLEDRISTIFDEREYNE